MLPLHTPERSCVPGPTFAPQRWGARSINPESIGPETLPVGKPLAHGPRPSLGLAPTPPVRSTHPEEKLRYSVARRVVEWTRRLRLQLGDPPQPCPPRTRPSTLTTRAGQEQTCALSPVTLPASWRLGSTPSSGPLTFSAGSPRARLSRLMPAASTPVFPAHGPPPSSDPLLNACPPPGCHGDCLRPRQPLIGPTPDRGEHLLVNRSRDAPTRRRFGKTQPRGTWRSPTREEAAPLPSLAVQD